MGELDAVVALPAAFYARSTRVVARALIGTYVVHRSAEGTTVGRVVETEAYLGRRDPAAHSYRGPTERTRAMFGPPGRLYVYFIYGVHHCCNVVTRPAGTGEAVLLRALEPVEGIELMRARRGVTRERDLCSGPGKLVAAMGLGSEHDGAPLSGPDVLVVGRDGWPGHEGAARPRIVTTTRVGITKAADEPLRFYEASSAHVSRR